jgi:hypothetical protein
VLRGFAVLLFLGVLVGPLIVLMWRSANAPTPKPADPVRPLCVIATIVALLGLLMPLWTVLAGETGYDPLGILEPDAGHLGLYPAALVCLLAAWTTNGKTRATQNRVLAWLHGATFLLLAPSFFVFVFLMIFYDEAGHT